MILKGILKMKNKKGFTLAELLIVVAIIAVLVAVSIPVFSSQLEKSREVTDAANIRSQYSEIMVEALSEGKDVNTDGSRKIPLEQKQNNWQNDTFKNSLEGIATVEGTPKAGGNAWVSFEAENSKVTIHFDGAGGGEPSGGGESGGSSAIIPKGTEKPLEGYSGMSDGNYSMSLNSPFSGTIYINIVVHAGGHGNGTIKDKIRLEVHEGDNLLEFANHAGVGNSSFSISFEDDISEDDFKKLEKTIKITKIN